MLHWWPPQFFLSMSPFYLIEVSLSLPHCSLSVCSRLCLSLCAHQQSHCHLSSWCCWWFHSLVVLLMLLVVVVWLLLQVMCRSSFSCHDMRCNDVHMGCFSHTGLFITNNICICIFWNLFSCHFHLVCCLCKICYFNISFHCVVWWVFVYNIYLKEGVKELFIKLVKIYDVKQLRSYIKPLTKAPCFGSSENLSPSPICSKRKVGSLEGLQVKSNPKSQLCLNGVILTWRTTGSS